MTNLTPGQQIKIYNKMKAITRSKDDIQVAFIDVLNKYDEMPTDKDISRALNNAKTKNRTQRLNNVGLSARKNPKGNLEAPINSYADIDLYLESNIK